MNRTSISIARLVALNVPRSWQEAVAVVLEAGDAMKAAGKGATADQCFISAAGGLHMQGAGRPGGGPGEATADLLATLLTGQVAPTELRALTEQGAGGIDELMKALAYFERPNRQADIAALATRAMAMDAQAAAADSELARLRAASPAGSTVPPPDASQSTGGRRQSGRLLAVLLLVIVAAAAFAWYRNRPAVPAVDTAAAEGSAQPTPPPSTVGSLVSAATEALSTAADAGLRAVGLGPSEPTPAAATPPAAARPAGTSARRTPPAPAGGTGASTAEPTPSAAPPAAAVVELPVIVAEPDESAMPPEVPPGPYTEADADVQPPVLVYPQLPTEPRPSPPASAPHFELLVNERGEVDQVRLRATDANVQDRMMVSAAKAWRFSPATKDGKPVRYRVRVTIPR
jgi:protein TonB